MNYVDELKKESFQIFNSVSDFTNYVENEKSFKKIKTIFLLEKIDEISKKLGFNSSLYIFLGTFLFLLERYGRQNSILIKLNYNKKSLPIGIESNESTTLKQFFEDLNEKVLGFNNSLLNKSDDNNNVNFYFNCKSNSEKGIISLFVFEKNGNYEIVLKYASNYYERNTMKFFIRHFRNVIDNLYDNINKKLCDIELADQDELKIINTKFNKEYKNIDSKKTITDVIEENSKKYKSKKAVIYDGKFISYKELNERANVIANKLIEKKIGNGDFVVIIPERSIEMIIGILAILKSGAAYVPIDPKYPEDRISYIIEVCEPKLIMVSNNNMNFFDKIPTMNITNIDYSGNIDNPVRIQNNDSVAYSIFTSGTTGRPKGVVLKHKGLYNLVFNYKKIYGITNKDTLLQFASIAFDQSVWDIFTILGLGGTLCLMPSELINEPRKLELYMEKNRVSVAALTPAYIKLLNPDNLKSLRVIESGSAAADYDNLKSWITNRRVFNTYGPTEATVNTLSYEISSMDCRVLPIGKPIQNVKIFIISNGHLCGIGEPGELCIAGYGVAKEYLKQPEKSEQAFVDCPFDDGKMYRSGDLVKYRSDGQIIYIGRIDDQIKIRGYRIELGEIENCIKNINYVKDTYLLVETLSDGEKEINAYILSDKAISSKNIKEYLSSKLPYYMIPSHIYQVDYIPLTINGKIDKQKIKTMIKREKNNCVLPKTKFEKNAVEIYKRILKDDNIGVTDDFYEIGGSSIKAILIVSELRNLGYNYRVCDLLSTKTIRNLGKLKVSFCSESRYNLLNDDKYRDKIVELEKKIDSRAINISYLTPTQMYMLEAYRKHIVGDNFLQYFYKCSQDINVDILIKAIELLPVKNEALTTVIVDDNIRPYQVMFDNRNIEFEEINNVSYEEYQEICNNDIIRGFDIENEPMLRFKLFRLNNHDIKLLFSVSHMILDGWSVELVIQDLSCIYEKLVSNYSFLELKKIYNQNNSVSLSECYSIINEEQNNKMKKYWDSYFKNIGKSVTVPYDDIKTEIGNWTMVDWIDKNETIQIKEFCKKKSISENTFFEFAFAYLLAISNKCNSSFFYKVISGRDLPVLNIDSIVGMLINIIPQTIEINDNYVKNLQDLNNSLLENAKFDKYDFYHRKVNNKLLMNEGKTIFVFSNYYELTDSIFEYEFDRDQDEVDMSFFVDSMNDRYHILITCKKSLYSMNKLKKICMLYRNIINVMLSEGDFSGLFL